MAKKKQETHFGKPIRIDPTKVLSLEEGRRLIEELQRRQEALERRNEELERRQTPVTRGGLTDNSQRESEELYRSLFNNMLNGMAYCQMLFENGEPKDFVYLMVNEAFGNLTGLTDVVGKKVSEVIPGIREYDPDLFEIYGRVVTTGHPVRFEKHLKALQMWFWISVYRPKPDHFVAVFDVITERKQTEESLKQSKERLELAQRSANAGVWDWDMLTGRLDWSEELFKLFGLDPEKSEATFNTWNRLLHPEDLEIAASRIAQSVKEKKPLDSEYRILYPDGTIHWVKALGSSEYDSSGRPLRMAGICIDITNQKRVDAELKDAQHLAHIGSWYWDAKTDVTTGSDELLRIYGFDPAKQTMPNFNDQRGQCYPIPDWERIAAAVKKTVQTGVGYELDVRVIRGDSLGWATTRSEAVRDNHGAIIGLRGTVQDITERKRAEEALRESEERLKAHLDHSPLAIIEWDESFVVTRWTGEAETIFGWKAEEAVGKPIMNLNLIFPDDIPIVEKTMQRLTNGVSRRVVSSNRNVAKNGRVIFCEWYNSVQYVDGKMKSVMSQVLDATARWQAETEREKLQQQMIQAAKMESIGRLAGGVAHDFNNMLGVILGHVDLIMDSAESGGPLQKGLLQIRKAAKRSADMTRQLLAFARKQTIQPKVLNLNDTITSMLRMLQPLIGENVQLIWVPGTDVGAVKMDPGQIDQTLANLCANARDAISGVGEIILKTGRFRLDEASCKTRDEVIPGEYAMLSVSDSGCGMDNETLSHVFEPFFTTKEIGKGTGLGLATVFGIVKQNNGFIEVSSDPGKGTTFRIFLPHFEVQEAVPDSPHSGSNVFHGAETILMVEDEAELLDLAQTILKKFGYSVLATESPAGALKLAEAHSGKIDLLLTDVILPGMDGRELSLRLQDLFPNIATVFMSGYPANIVAKHGILKENIRFIQKPFDVADLLKMVRAALSDNTPS